MYLLNKVALNILILMTISLTPLYGQRDTSNSIYLNVSIGSYIPIFPLEEGLSKSGFTFGGGMGFQVFDHYMISGTLLYLKTSGVPLIHYYDNTGNGHLTHDGDYKFELWTYQVSLQYKLVNENYIMASIFCGILFSKANLKKESVQYKYISETRYKNIMGGFVGGEFEFPLFDHTTSIVGDSQLGYSTGDKISYGDTSNEIFLGFRMTVGIRYYIKL